MAGLPICKPARSSKFAAAKFTRSKRWAPACLTAPKPVGSSNLIACRQVVLLQELADRDVDFHPLLGRKISMMAAWNGHQLILHTGFGQSFVQVDGLLIVHRWIG